MIKINLKNAITKNAITKYSKLIKKLASKMENLNSLGSDFLGWKDLALKFNKLEFKDMIRKSQELKKNNVDTLVIIGIGGSYCGAKAAINMIQGLYSQNQDMEVIFVGESVSSSDLIQKLAYVKNKNFAINVISKSGTTLEPALAFRIFRQFLEKKIGTENASKFIIVTTDQNKGTLIKQAKENSYKKFYIPSNVGGRFSVLTPVGLFPLICAGINVKKIIKGASEATKKYNNLILEENDAYKYAVARFILMKRYPIELMIQYEPQMIGFNEWWKQLVGESEGKKSKGLFPASAIFSTDLHSLGQFIQEGSKVLFETVMTVSEPKFDMKIPEDKKNFDKLNYLTSKTIHKINEVVFRATKDAHIKVGKIPNIHIEFSKLDEISFGELVIFFERAISMTAYLMEVNPFDQTGVEVYKKNIFYQLNKE